MHHGVTLTLATYFGRPKVSSPAIFETSFTYDKDIWIAATNLLLYALHIIVLFPEIYILQLINFTAS